jgi:hypothetical protein
MAKWKCSCPIDPMVSAKHNRKAGGYRTKGSNFQLGTFAKLHNPHLFKTISKAANFSRGFTKP